MTTVFLVKIHLQTSLCLILVQGDSDSTEHRQLLPAKFHCARAAEEAIPQWRAKFDDISGL